MGSASTRDTASMCGKAEDAVLRLQFGVGAGVTGAAGAAGCELCRGWRGAGAEGLGGGAAAAAAGRAGAGAAGAAAGAGEEEGDAAGGASGLLGDLAADLWASWGRLCFERWFLLCWWLSFTFLFGLTCSTSAGTSSGVASWSSSSEEATDESVAAAVGVDTGREAAGVEGVSALGLSASLLTQLFICSLATNSALMVTILGQARLRCAGLRGRSFARALCSSTSTLHAARHNNTGRRLRCVLCAALDRGTGDGGPVWCRLKTRRSPSQSRQSGSGWAG